MTKQWIAALHVTLVIVLAAATVFGQDQSARPGQPIPKEKQTRRGLYVTAKEAYEKWKADPGKVRILDVRTPEEYIYIGHPEMAWNIPLAVQAYKWDSSEQDFAMELNLDFVPRAKEVFTLEDTLLVMCRSGGRSAMAVNLLTDAGFKNVYNVIDGMEGDKVQDPESVFRGMRMKNGWKNSGLPWTYDLNPERMRLPKRQ